MSSLLQWAHLVTDLSVVCFGFSKYLPEYNVYPLGVIPLFLMKVADIIAPKQNIIFPRIIRLGSFPECWLSANVTAIPKGAPSPDRENCRPILITPILFNEYEELVSHKLSSFCEKYVFCLLLCLLRCTANHISSPSEVARYINGVLYCSARLKCSIR